MSKKKKVHHKKRTTRRRRSRVAGIGMLPGVPLEQIAAFMGGAIVSQGLNGVGKNIKAFQNNPKLLPILKIGIGTALLIKSNNPTLKDFGGGMIAGGSLHLLSEVAPNVFKTLSGGQVNGIGTTLIDLDSIGYQSDYIYSEDHSVSGYPTDDYSVGAV